MVQDVSLCTRYSNALEFFGYGMYLNGVESYQCSVLTHDDLFDINIYTFIIVICFLETCVYMCDYA